MNSETPTGKRPCVSIIVFSLLLATVAPVGAQSGGSQPVATSDDGVVSGSLRTRVESWDWFRGDANGQYAFSGSLARLGVSQSKKAYDWQIEVALPFLIGLPGNATAPGAQGQLGFGAAYYAANGSNTNAAMLFIKQGFVRFNRLGGVKGQSLKVGRMEFFDGAEVTPKNATLAGVKRDRIAQRLLGNFGFTDVQRSFDGAQYSLDHGSLNFTVLGARPTQGVFQVDGWGELNINVFYGALTGQLGGGTNAAEWRVFGLGYDDYRPNVVKTDNRPLTARQADTQSIEIGTFGGHYIHVAQTPAGAVDVLLWGAVQTGSWGTLAQRAGAFAAEAGWQPPILDGVRPWIRGGYDYGSGDGDPNDGTHGTFFLMLPTPRGYARFPFFNMMNSGDAFGELIIRPSQKFNVRSDLHVLRLAAREDLWYLGGGAFQPQTFGFTGRPSNGRVGLATLYDASGDYAVNPHVSVTAYFGYAAGKETIRAIYPNGSDGRLAYVELLLHF